MISTFLPLECIVLDDPARRCRVTYEPGFIPRHEADALLDRLLREAPFTAETPVIFGRAIEVRRKSCSYGDPGIRYRYAGVTRVAAPWPEALRALHERVMRTTGVPFNYALCNLYPDGAAGLGWHADDEDDMEPNAPIASISLGAPRDFALRLGRSGPACVTVTLGHGSLLVMEGETQRHYQHRVPPRRRCRQPRVNLTFRVIRGPA